MTKETADPRLSHEEFQEIREVARLVAEFYVVSLKKGFKNEAIATTFTALFLRELCQLMDEETVNIMLPQISVTPLTDMKSGNKASHSVCLKLSSAFIRAVTDLLKEKNLEECSSFEK